MLSLPRLLKLIGHICTWGPRKLSFSKPKQKNETKKIGLKIDLMKRPAQFNYIPISKIFKSIHIPEAN